jgi:flagellar protein FliS
MAQAKGALARGDIAEKGLMLGKAIDIIIGLSDGLDAQKSADPAYIEQLSSLYAYMTNRLMQANIDNDPAIIDEVAQLLITVKSGWDAIADAQPAG